MDIDIEVGKSMAVRDAIYAACEGVDNQMLVLILCGILGETIFNSGKGSVEECTELVTDLIKSYIAHAAGEQNG